jgi:hypothetical protein
VLWHVRKGDDATIAGAIVIRISISPRAAGKVVRKPDMVRGVDLKRWIRCDPWRRFTAPSGATLRPQPELVFRSQTRGFSRESCG